MQRHYSLYTLLGGLVLIPFGLVALVLLFLGYRSASEAAGRELDHSFQQNFSLIQVVLGNELDQARDELKALSSHPALRVAASEGPAELKRSLTYLESIGLLERFDHLVLVGAQNGYCADYSPPLHRHAGQCTNLLGQPAWSGWRLQRLDAQTGPGPVAFMAHYPVIDLATGQVVADLYGGVALTNNYSLISRAKNAAPEQTRAVALALGNRLLVSSARAGSYEEEALLKALQAEGQQLVSERQLLVKGFPTALDSSGHLRLYSVADGAGYATLRNSFVFQLSLAVLLCVLLAAAVSLSAMHMTLNPLRRLLAYAKQARQGEQPVFQQGAIQEFNQLSHELAEIVSDLHSSEQRMQHYAADLEVSRAQMERANLSLAERGRQLEKSHQELSVAMRENRNLLHRMLRLQEQERKHLAQELHDDLGQALAVVSADAYLIQSKVEPDSQLQQSALSIYERAQEMYDIVYNRIKQLRPMPLDDLGLLDALRFMPAIDSLKQHGVAVEVELPERLAALPENLQITLYRIAQEGLVNTLKHADADQAWLRLRVDPLGHSLTLEVEDDGKGITPGKRPQSFGLAGIEERTAALQGSFRIDPVDPRGTRISVTLPLPTSFAAPAPAIDG